MKNKILLLITIVSVFSFNCLAQDKKVTQGDKKYDSYAYIDAIKTYERVAEKGYKSAEMFKKLANAYYFNGEYDKAARWYGELFAMTSDLEQEYYYRYAASLKSIGQNDEADEIMKKCNQKLEMKLDKSFSKTRTKLNNNPTILLKNNYHEK